MKHQEFYDLISDILCSNEFRQMKHHRHHVKSNARDHSIKVAFLCYLYHKKFSPDFELREFVRGALLHDYYLYDWHDRTPATRHHVIAHPRRALRNAKQKYPELSDMQRDMILHHMFPLTPMPPTTRAGWLLWFYDKVAAIGDYRRPSSSSAKGKKSRYRKTSHHK
jgi:uncharacterized protein